MIKLFRKIRQNLLSDGKTEKYFKYTIEEKVVVAKTFVITRKLKKSYSAFPSREGTQGWVKL